MSFPPYVITSAVNHKKEDGSYRSFGYQSFISDPINPATPSQKSLILFQILTRELITFVCFVYLCINYYYFLFCISTVCLINRENVHVLDIIKKKFTFISVITLHISDCMLQTSTSSPVLCTRGKYVFGI